jgi:RNA polymerase sigma-70 factor (ECF subfamily)
VDSKLKIFNQFRPKLQGVAYRMLGSRADAEDVLQEAYLRWHKTELAQLRSPEAWLVTVVTRLSVDRLRAARSERETYFGEWIPEPLVESHAPSADQTIEMAGDLSIAFLVVLERLSPEERAAFLLHDVFDFDYSEIAPILGKRQDACRQIVSRARQRVRKDRPRFEVSRTAHLQLLERFMDATRSGDRDALMALFSEDVTLTSDGGGKVSSINRVLHGAKPVTRLLHGIARHFGPKMSFELANINGVAGILRFFDGQLESATSLVTDGQHIIEIYSVRNPDKLSDIIVD